MTYIVSHFLIVVFALVLIRKAFPKIRKSLTNHAIMLGGFFGILPDFDLPMLWIYNIINSQPISIYHRFFFHNVFWVIAFALIALVLCASKKKRISMIFTLLAFAFSIHLAIDFITGELILFYPVIKEYFGMRLLHIGEAGYHVTAAIDAFLFLCLLAYLTIKGRIKNLI